MADPWAEFTAVGTSGKKPGEIDPWAEFTSAASKKDEPAKQPDVAYDMAASGAAGLAQGAIGLPAAPADIGNLAQRGFDKFILNPLLRLTGQPEAQPYESKLFNKLGSQNLQKQVEKVTGEFHKPETLAGEYAHTIGQTIPGAITAPGGGAIGNALRYGMTPAIAAETAGQSAKGEWYEPYVRAAAGVGATLINPARIITPMPTTEARRQFVDTLRNEGVTSLTAGQKTGNESLRYLESASSSAPGAGHGAARIEGQGRQQFTEAAMRRAGTGPDATPEVLGANQRRLGNEFERLSSQHTLVPDNQFINDMTDAVRNYRNVPNSQQRAMVQGYIDDIIPHVNNGTMPGPMYQEMRSRLSRQANSLRQSDPTLAEALRDMRNSLDNAMSRSIPAEEQQAWQTARREYGAQKVLEKAASRAGEAAAEGQITPTTLRNAVAGENRGAYARGEGDFSDLARAGAAVMTPLPNSGTAQRLNAFNLLNSATLGVVPAVTGRALMSRPAQAYLANELPGQRYVGQLLGANAPDNIAARKMLLIQALQRQANQPAQGQ